MRSQPCMQYISHVVRTTNHGHPTTIIGLGSNLGSKEAILDTARVILASKGIVSLRSSSRYQSAALSSPTLSTVQPDYLNEVWKIQTLKPLENILDILRSVEEIFCRTRTSVWSSRTLDIDILISTQAYRSKRLTIPHPQILKRSFVIAPLLDIYPQLAPILRSYLSIIPPTYHSPPIIKKHRDTFYSIGEPIDALGTLLNTICFENISITVIRMLKMESLGQLPVLLSNIRVRSLAILSTNPWTILVAGSLGVPRRKLKNIEMFSKQVIIQVQP